MFRIDADRARFREIVRGRIRADLRKYLSTAELIARRGDQAVSVEIPSRLGPRQFGQSPSSPALPAWTPGAKASRARVSGARVGRARAAESMANGFMNLGRGVGSGSLRSEACFASSR